MVLEQFIIDADIIWDQVGKTFFENPEAKPGRIMRVQVVNAGIIEDLIGYTLNLGWTSVRDPSKFGLDAFDDIDITKGIFEIEYTSGMLTNIGPLNASLQLVPPGEGRPIESNNFKLTVKNSAINPEAIQGETSFKALENALVEVNGWNARIDEVEQEFKDRADALDEAYPVRLADVEQKYTLADARISNIVATAGDGTIPSELSDIRVGKNGDLYLSAGDFTRAASEGRVPKTELDGLAGYKYPSSNQGFLVTPRVYNGRTLGVLFTATIVDTPLYVFARARVKGKNFADVKGKKFKVTVRSDVDVTVDVKSANGGAWGSADNKIGMIESFQLTLNSANKRVASVNFDLSNSIYDTFYNDPLRTVIAYQELDFLLTLNNGVKNPVGVYNLTYEVSEVVSDKFEDLTVMRQIPEAAYAVTAGNALTANSATTAVSATTATTATTATSAGTAGTATKATTSDRAISADFAVNAGLGNFFATARLAWEGIGATILDLEKYNTLRIKYAAGVATGSIYYVRIPLCTKVSDLIGRTIIMNGKNLNAGVVGDIGDAGFFVGFSCVNSGQWGNVKYAWGFATTLDSDELSGDTLRAALLAAGYTDNSPVYVQLSNSSAYYPQTPYSCDKTVQVLLTAKTSETTVVATKLLGFNQLDYELKSAENTATPGIVNTYSGAPFNTYTKVVSGLISRVTRPEISNPDALWNYGLISVNLGPLSGLAGKEFLVHFDDTNSAQKFRYEPKITKSSTNWSSSMNLPTHSTPDFYKAYQKEDLYDKIAANGTWGPTDNVYLCFTYEVPVGGPTIVPATDITMSVLSLVTGDYTTKTSLKAADLLNGFDPSKYALAEDLKAAIEEVLSAADYITCWGDSLTAGGGWTTTLGTLSGKVVYNGGTGGENVPTIVARQGADVMVVNTITIPANNTDTVLIASKNVEGGIKTAFGKTVTPLLQGGAHVNPIMIDGILGTLRWTGSSYSDPLGTWTFQRTTAGTEKVINRPTAMTTDFDRNRNAGIQVIFIGQNGGYADDAELVNTIKLMIAHSSAKNTIVLGLSSGSAASRAAYETAMRAAFGRYFISLREYLSTYGIADAGLTPTQADTDAMATGTVPPQLLADSVHYTTATKTVIGNMLYKKMVELNIF